MAERKKSRSQEERAASRARADFQVRKLRELATRNLDLAPDEVDEYFRTLEKRVLGRLPQNYPG